MIRINITDEQGTLLGQVTLDMDDTNPHSGELVASWVGQSIIDELPGNPDALHKLLKKEGK